MKMYWSAFLSLFLLTALVGCGSEQFGAVPQAEKQAPNSLVSFKQASCSNSTLVKPVVDVLYLVDNSTSTFYVGSDIKNAIAKTVSSISSKFDYRIIGAPLLSNDTDDFQVLAKDETTLPSTFDSRKVTGASQFSFFSNTSTTAGSNEPGTKRVRDFLTAHQADGLFRQDGYLFVVLVSNGRDTELETQISASTPQTQQTSVYLTRLAELKAVKNYFNSKQFRLFSLTPLTSCQSGWRASKLSYASMSKDLYNDHMNPILNDQIGKQYPDNYDLCSSVSTVFNSVNNTIQQVIVPHKYQYWPITFTDSENMDTSKIKVFKSSPNSGPVQITTGWNYFPNPNRSPINTKVAPLPTGEPTTARHLIQFTPGDEIVYPDCISITSTTNLEYFQYIVLDRPPKVETVIVKINGIAISQSATDGWSYSGYLFDTNIKVAVGSYSALPEAKRTGYMVKLNGAANYYKSGDNVEIYYLPDSI